VLDLCDVGGRDFESDAATFASIIELPDESKAHLPWSFAWILRVRNLLPCVLGFPQALDLC
jgi:hypothetical protein